jgi:glutamyl-Q tRNA(Asp) synthetase
MPGASTEAGAARTTASVAAYVGRFAPSPTGLLHAGSLVAALASWLDARAHRGRWLLRIEDVDTPRCSPEAARGILAQLDVLGLRPDEPPWWQSRRHDAYAAALHRLITQGQAYPCACSRSDVARVWAQQGRAAQRGEELPYPGTCRSGLNGRAARATRFRVTTGAVRWQDRRLGTQMQHVAQQVGDFVLQRADGLWAYQLAVVVDDAAQGITDVVRGEDLADNTARQQMLLVALGLPVPSYLHTPLVLASDGHKLSKQNGALALELGSAQAVHGALNTAAQVLGLDPASATASANDQLQTFVAQWRQRWLKPGR